MSTNCHITCTIPGCNYTINLFATSKTDAEKYLKEISKIPKFDGEHNHQFLIEETEKPQEDPTLAELDQNLEHMEQLAETYPDGEIPEN